MQNKLNEFIELVANSIADQTFVKMSLGNYKGNELNLKNIYIKLIRIKEAEKLSFTYRYKTKDIVKNYSQSEALLFFAEHISADSFQIANLFTLKNDFQLIIGKNYKQELKTTKASQIQRLDTEHNKEKNRLISAKGNYLQALKLTDKTGVVFKNAQDKYKQINHYIELLAPLLKEVPNRGSLNVVDMGSGKGYLTFALYDYLTNVIKLKTNVIGVEFRPDLVKLCNEIAQKSNFEGLSFSEGSILDYDAAQANILIALHACDTATDDAIFKGIKANADLIVVAPCCHKQIRREMEKGKATNELDFLTTHGIFMERQAEMVTDGLRALIMEFFGYKTKVFQFISDEHTPKNVMITAVKKTVTAKRKVEILEKIKPIKTYFGIEKFYLSEMFNL